MLAFIYRTLTDLGAPFIRFYLFKRRLDGREDKYRFRERLGYPSVLRPAVKRMVWCHAASVGEAASLLTLIDAIREAYPDTGIVVTTGTVTSARMLEKRLPQGGIHQYVPVDRVAYVKRFLATWRPSLALWVESELWPNTLAELRNHDVPAILLNGRMSAKSFRGWWQRKNWAKEILSTFKTCFVQSEEARGYYKLLGAKDVRMMGNLKYAVKPLAFDANELLRLQQQVSLRPVWGMISTHRGEEDIAIKTHKELIAKIPNLLTVIVPRHAVRGDEIAQKLTSAQENFARRSRSEGVTDKIGFYLADTMGELGLFCRLCQAVVMGGSFVSVGGHNPVEPAQLGATIVFGPSMYNFSAIAREFITNRAAVQVRQAHELAYTIRRLLADPVERSMLAKEAQSLVEQKRHVVSDILAELHPWLSGQGTKP